MKVFLLTIFFSLFLFAANAQTTGEVTIHPFKIEELKDRFSSGDSIYVINFWATFCKPCLEEIPYMQTISKKYEASKVKLILVSLDVPSVYREKLAAFAAKSNMTAEVGWLNESNADKFCPVIDPTWSGAIPATLIFNSKTGYKKFTEEEYKPEEFERELKKAIN